MLFDAKMPLGLSAKTWEQIGPNSPAGNQMNDIAVTSDHRWLFAACGGWWAIIDLQQDKCVSRHLCTPAQDGQLSSPTSVALSSDDQHFYVVTDTGTVESYDIRAAKAGEVKSIPNQCFWKMTVDPNNQFLFIGSASGNLYKYDTG
jgi:WD40 repeat protein